MRYAKVIEEYCASHGVTIPLGFRRQDVLYYLKHSDRSVATILDFKERVELQFDVSGLRGRPPIS